MLGTTDFRQILGIGDTSSDPRLVARLLIPSSLDPFMRAWMKSLPIGISLLLCGSGCCCLKRCCCSWSSPTPQLECRQVEPQPIVPDLSLVPKDLPPAFPGGQYCALSERDAQCLAAKNSKTANLLEQEADAVATQKKCFHDGTALAQDILILQATHKRNLDASIALQLFLKLAEAEGGTQNLQKRLHELDGMLSDADELQSRGVASPISKNGLEMQRLELLHRQAEVQGTIDRLNSQLADALGVELPPNSRYWPEVDLLVDPELPVVEEAVYTAFGNRADLAALRIAAQADGREAIAAARLLLQPLGVGLATSGSSHCLAKLMALCSHHNESDVRSDQLNQAYQDHRRTVEHEVRQAINLQTMRLTQLALSRDRQHVAQVLLKSTERQQEMTVAPFGVRKSRLDGLAADQDLLHDVIEWKIAVVRLREAQGLLAIECGYDAAARCR